MQLQEYTLVLTGGNNTRTVLLNHVYFKNGVGKARLYPNELDTFLRYMGRSYKAYLAGSAELEAAQKRDEANGIQRNFPKTSEGADGAPDAVQGAADSGSGSVSDPRTLPDGGTVENSAGSAGMVPGGPGHADAGLGEGVESQPNSESGALIRSIQSAVTGMAWDNADAWNEAGWPSVEYVCEALQNQSITREMIEFACPGYNREKAEDAQNL